MWTTAGTNHLKPSRCRKPKVKLRHVILIISAILLCSVNLGPVILRHRQRSAQVGELKRSGSVSRLICLRLELYERKPCVDKLTQSPLPWPGLRCKSAKLGLVVLKHIRTDHAIRPRLTRTKV